MATSNTVISNMALGHLAHGKEIAALDTENSEAAIACRRYFEECRKYVLRDFAWPFANKSATLSLVESNPTTEWAYSYRLPSDSVFIKRIFSGTRNDTHNSRSPYRLGKDASGLLIYSDESPATVEYTEDVSTYEFWLSDFTLAFSYKLANLVAPHLTSGDPYRS